MRIRTFLLSASPLLLASCAAGGVSQDPLDNPLYAEWYYEDAVDHVVTLELNADESLKNPDAKRAADAMRQKGLAEADKAERLQLTGLYGQLIEVKEAAAGEVLLRDGALYVSPDFITAPGVDLRVYLSTAVDPRELRFPGESDIEAGPLKTPYGAQALAVPGELPDIRSVVIWDKALKRMHAFAQVRRAQAEE